jgi:hypothetical protein
LDKAHTDACFRRGLDSPPTGLRFLVEVGFFDGHVFEFTGFEDFAAFEALDEFGVFLTGNDLHARVFTRCHGWFFRETELKLEVIIRIASSCPSGQDLAGIGVFLALSGRLSSTERSFLALYQARRLSS